MSAVRQLAVLLASLAVAGCASNTPVVLPQPVQPVSYEQAVFDEQAASNKQTVPAERPELKTVYVVGHGWHTGIVVRSRDVSADLLPEILDFSDMDYVEFGWGDEGFYRAKKITAPLVLKAAFWPTATVVHVAGIRGSVPEFYQYSDIIEVQLSSEQFNELCQFFGNAFKRDESGMPIPLGPGIYGKSRFYRAKGKYSAANTCNVWTAKALRRADCPILPPTTITADSVLKRVRKSGGHVVQQSPRGLKKAALAGSE